MIPHTDIEKLILLEEIQRGDKVIIPTSVAHAEFMLMVANAYINEHKKEMWSILTQ